MEQEKEILDQQTQSPSLSIMDNGERVCHLYANDCYYAHLSIYRFATQYCLDGEVLDAGSGAGYGSAYLADHGAHSVLGVEIDREAVNFSQEHFKKDNLRYQHMDLTKISSLPRENFDLVFSSNVIEHVVNPHLFFRAAAGLLKPSGHLVLAVPPITRDVDWQENIANVYHLNIWTPRMWVHVVSQYFSKVQCFHHSFYKPGYPLNFANTPAESRINENDFLFTPISVEEYYTNPSLTVVLLAQTPRKSSEMPPKEEQGIYLENSFSRLPQVSESEAISQPASKHTELTKSILHKIKKFDKKVT